MICAGDLVMRKYDIRLPKFTRVGFVIERDSNGFLTISWGPNVEHMWDDYDLVRID